MVIRENNIAFYGIKLKENKDMKKELIKNKIFALGMIAGGITILIASKDATILLLTVLFGVPLFVAKRNYID